MSNREREFQALLEIYETINCEGEPNDTLDNEECNSIIAAFGAGVDLYGSFDLRRARYGKYFVVTDGGAPGLHIQKQVVYLLQTYMFPLLDSGRVYVPANPLAVDITPEEFASRVLRPATREFRKVWAATSREETLAALKLSQ